MYCLERPIEREAFNGEYAAVNFLITEFNGDQDSAVQEYARANKPAVDKVGQRTAKPNK